MKNDASSVLFRRLPYMLSPQLDIYEKLGPFVREKRVLEVGFGTGIGVLQYAHVANFTVAIEIDEAAVRFARRCFKIPNVLWERNAVEQIFEKTADFVVMIEVLEHVSDPTVALTHIRNCLRPEGRALITVPNKNRDRKKDDPLIENEWDAYSFYELLLKHFDDVRFLNFELRELGFGIPEALRTTPLIALCS